jgi:hypothetical protein
MQNNWENTNAPTTKSDAAGSFSMAGGKPAPKDSVREILILDIGLRIEC